MGTRFRFTGRIALLLALLLVLALPQIAAAANTVVTPANPDGWGPTDVRTNATVGITADNARDGLGSLKFTTNTVTSGQDKADFTKTWTDPTRTLTALSDVSYDFYRASTSTTAAHFAPVLRLMFFQDNAPTGGLPGAEDHTGYLIWEQSYNGYNPVPTNTWHAPNLTSGYFWMRLVSGPNTLTPSGCNKTIQNFNVTLADWKTTVPVGVSGDCPAPDFTTSSPVYIYGVNTGVGSGWGATFLGYADNVVVKFGSDVVSANFEPNPACTTVCYADTATGNNANGGASAADAKKTIQAAVTQVTAGGQVFVAAGTYAEDVNVNKAVTITGAGPATTIIDPVNYVGVTADNVTIKDIAMSNGTHGVRLSKTGSPLANTTFDNVHFKNNTSRGIDIVNLLHVVNLQVLNSLFEGNAAGIRMPSNATADGITIVNTTFQNQTGSGFYEANDNNVGWVKNLTVRNSTFTNLGTSGSGHAGVYAEEFSNVLIENSHFSGNPYGINLFDAYSVASSVTTNVTIRGNDFTNHKATTIAFRSTTSDPNAQLALIEDNTINQNVSGAIGSYAALAVTTSGSNANGAVDVVDNVINFSGTLPTGVATTYGIYAQGGVEDVRIEGNDVDGGGIANNGGTIPPSGVYFSTFSMKPAAVVLITKNELTGFVNGISLHSGSAFGGVKSPGFDVVRNDLSSNSGYGLRSGPTLVSDGTCNWWGDASGPSGQGIGSGSAVSTHVDFATWLGTNDLTGACVAGATIKVSKVTDPNTDTTTVFTFDPSWSATNFTLKNGESLTSAPLAPATYAVVEVSMPALWAQQSATCDNTATGPVETADPSNLTVAAGENWECTFTNKQLELCSAVCYADADNGSDADDGKTLATAFKTIQKAIDTVAVNGTVRVLPGDYSETASDRYILGSEGPYVFGLFIAKDGVTVQGVTAADLPITDPGAMEARVETNSTASFGPDGIFVEGDGVTIAGLEIGPNVPGQNKTIEIIGDAFTLKDSFVNDPIGSVYFNDWQFDTGSDTSHVQSYTIDHNVFASGVSVDLTSGAGLSGPVNGRQITDNIFEMSPGETWPVISFNGSGTGVEWFVQSVGGAVITGNTFNNTGYGAVQWIRARGDYDNSQFDWASYWNNNTYDNAVVFGSNPPSVVGEWSYTSGSYTFNHVRRIGAVIQEEVSHAPAIATVLVNDGFYPENVTIDKSLTLRGSGQTNDANGTVLEGTGLTGSAILVNTGVTDVTIENLRAQNYSLSAAAGVYANGQNNNFTVRNVTSVNNGIAGNNGGGVYMNGPVDHVVIDHVTATGNRSRGIVIWNGFKTNITITNNTVTNNVCCGIELQDGTASGVTVTGNTVNGNADSGMAFTGLTSGAGPNVISGNTLTNNGRFGIEIKLPNGTGLATGDGSIVIENNTVTLNAPPADLRDFAGIAAFRRGWVAGNNNVDIPTGVIIRNNIVNGYAQNNAGSNSEGFGIVVEGTNMTVTGNTLNNNEVGVQVQGGHLPYVANTATDGDQGNLADQFFGRGNSPVGCALFDSNIFDNNATDTREVGAGGSIVAKNVQTGEQFCSIQAAIDDSDTVNGHTIEVFAGVHTENVNVNKSVTLEGANAGISPNDPGDPLNPNPARVAETEMASTGGNQSFKVQTANVTIDGFKFTDSGVAQANAQSPIIGAGVNFGGDAPGVKIVNNWFYETNRMVVYFIGPTLMQGGTVDDNRVENPDRPDTGCGSGAVATSNCGHQLFNLWNTNNVSFQDNVTIAAPASGDRIRTLNVNDSTNVTIAGNTVRYTCTYTCFTVAAGTANNVTVTDNDLVTDVGNVIQFFSTWTTGNVNVHHNSLTTGNDFPIVVDNLTADLDNVHINRNAVTGTYDARNGNDSLTTPGAETLDVTCNWWGSAAEPTAFFGPNDHTPWLFSSDLDGPCFVGGTISIDKVAPGAGAMLFEFDVSWSGPNVTLTDGDPAYVSAPLTAGNYSVSEVNLPAPWVQLSATCDNAATTQVTETADPSAITLADGDTWQCTFTNKNLPLCTTVCYVDAVNGDDAANGGTGPTDAFKTIQKAIDTVTPGGKVRVLPGTYDQDEKNGVDPTTGGAGANDFNIFVHKANITIQGVTASNVDITTAAGAQAFIKPKRAVPTFGVSTMFIQADGVTIQGVKFFAKNGAVLASKTVEVIGDDVTFDGVAFDVTGGAAGVYIGDFSYDAGNDVSTIADYLITNSAFTSTDQTGMAFQAANGAGWPDNVGTRAITNNTFVNLDDALTFAGAGSAGWRLYPVGTADITGNTFSQIKRRHVMAWGNYPISNPTALGYADPDWCGIIANNTFDKGSMLWAGTTQCPSGQPRRWDTVSGEPAPYDYFRNVAGIYSAIQQYGVNKAVSGDLLHVFPGTYVEQVTVNKTMTLLGSGPALTFIKPPATLPIASDPNSVIVKITGANVSVEMSEFTVSGPGPSGCGGILAGIFVRDGAYANIHDNKIVDIRDTGTSGCQNGIGIFVGRASFSTSGTADITDNEFSGYQKLGLVVSNTGSSANIEGNTFTGDGPISYIAENGIQVSGGATAEINHNTVTGHSYNGADWSSAGMLLYGPGTINTNGNTVSENQVGVYVVEAPGIHQNNTISATGTGTDVDYFWGLIVDAPPPNLNPAPFDAEADAALAANAPAPQAPLQTVTVTGNTFTSDNSPGGVGLATYAGYGASDIDLTATKNLIHNWALGVEVYECTGGGCVASTFTNVKINRNSIVGNTDGLFADTVDAAETDATCNWWGNASGPSDAGPGTGDSVSTEVDFNPWLYSSNLDGPCFTGGTISIDKVAAGGGALEFEFDLSWSDDNVKLTDAGAPYVSAPLPAGAYNISEVNLPAGWALDSATCVNGQATAQPSAITVADGDAWVCTFTNKPLGTIQIAKVAAGGGTTAFEFDVSWSQTNVTLTDGQSTTPVALAAGQYTIDEVNVPAGWTLASATCVNQTTSAPITNTPVTNDAVVTVANGDNWVCTFTNVKQGTIQIAKVAPGAGSQVFTFDVTWSDDNVTLTDGQSTTPVPLVAGNYGITEVNVPPGWASVSATCDNAITPAAEAVDPASITVANGDAWVCTFTNSLLGTVRIAKVATGGGTTTFEFAVSWSATNVTLADGQSTTAEPLAAGNYSVTEVNIPAGWVAQSATCDNGSTPTVETVNPSSIPVANGDAWVCTFTNVKQGTIQIAKVANGGGTTTFEFDVNWSGTNVTLQHGQSSTPVSLTPGSYSISEVNMPAGWTLQSATCDNTATTPVETANPSAITLANGDTWVCTFTNAKQGTVQIAKSAPGGGTTTFEFDVSWSGTNVTLQHGQSTTPVALAAGTYGITEVNLPQYWMLASATCVNGAETAPVSAIPVENGDAWVCTFNNVYAPSSTCAVGAANTQWTDLLGIGMGSAKKHKASAKIVIPNATNLVDLYGQLVAKSNGAAKYVRFMMPGKNNYVEVSTITGPVDHAGGNFWYGSDLPTAGTSYVTGKWFLQKSGTKGHIPRAFVLYPTYNDPAHTYVNVWDTYLPSEGEVDWNVAAGWTPRRTIVVPIAAPLGPETFHIELALADNDKDARPVWVTVTAGGVTQTVKPTNPDKGEQLNLLVFDLANVPAGTDEIVIEVYSPSQALDGVIGDSASLVGMTANYQCSPLSQP